MDFFEYASFASYFANTLWVQLLIGGLCFLIVFIFQALALYTIAAREGYQRKWMAFVPFFNTYYIGVCAQKNKFYNIDSKKIGIAAAVVEAILFIMYIIYYVACYLVIEYEYSREIVNSLGLSYTEYYLTEVPKNLAWAAWMYNYLDKYILSIGDLALVLMQICLFICFFQTYACRRYVLFTVTSIIFPIQGILFFVMRNNRGVNYKEYMAAEQARQYAMYQRYQQQNYQNPYNNPYNSNPYNSNPYNGNPYNRNPGQNNYQNPYGNPPQGTRPEDPFADFGGQENQGNNDYRNNRGNPNNSGSPFDDFDNN